MKSYLNRMILKIIPNFHRMGLVFLLKIIFFVNMLFMAILCATLRTFNLILRTAITNY